MNPIKQSVLEVYSVDGSTVAILNLSVAPCDSHEGISSLLLTFLRSGNVLFHFLVELDGFGVAQGKVVNDLLFFYASH